MFMPHLRDIKAACRMHPWRSTAKRRTSAPRRSTSEIYSGLQVPMEVLFVEHLKSGHVGQSFLGSLRGELSAVL